MAYVNVADWKAEQVAEWLKGLDGVVLQYIRLFVEKNVNGQQLLDLQPNDLEDIGVTKIGHQEIILEAIDLLKNFYYDLDRENLQLLALRLSCLSHSLLSELWKNHMNSSVVSTQVLADVANVVSAVKPLVCWLDRTPFCDQLSYVDKKTELSKLSVEMAMSGMRDKFAEKPIDNIRQSCKQLAELADTFIQGIDDSLLLQPASLDLATLKKRPGDHLGFYIVPSFHGILQVGELKCNSAAHQCGKIETGDEIVQINYQTVVGWEVKEVMSLLFEESSTEVLMTLKKRPRHSKVFGQIYIKPYRLPCKKQMSYSTKWNDILSPSRPELLSVPSHFGWPFRTVSVKPTTVSVMENSETKPPPSPTPSTASSISSRSSESELMAGPSSPNSVRLYLPKPRIPVQRRATITGASPVSKHAPLSLEQFWHELKLEREWRSNSDEKTEKANSETQLKRSAPTSHCSLNWSARLCEQSPNSSKSNISVDPEKGKLNKEHNAAEENGIIPLKQRIDCLNRAIEQTGSHNIKKPKLLPKPILSTKTPLKSDAPKSPFHVPNTPKETEVSTRRERSKLDKSYSTPSYDYSIDSKEPLMFNMKLLEEKVKSAPENITTEVEHSKSEFKKLEMKSLDAEQQQPQQETYTSAAELEQINEQYQRGGQQSTTIEYLEIKTEETPTNEEEGTERVNKIMDTIESTLKIDSESDISSNSTKDEPRNVVESKPPNYFTFDHSTIMPYTSSSSKLDTDSLRMEDLSSITSDTLRSNASDVSQPTERLHIHTTINVNVPATFPRHKMENKKAFPAPEPPPRPAKGSPIHSKFSKSSSVTKSSIKSPPHKSPKVTRKKNVWLTKRRNVSVKDLGVCDHEGWLYHRSRKMARGSPQWIKGWFIIKGTIFYGFNTREATHARLMISLPGFTVSPAEEVKSRNFSFKVYHTGTTFYFAAESGEDLHGWVESFSRVTVSDEEQSIVVSETDGEEDDESQPAKKDKSGGESSSSHLAAMKKLSGLITSHLGGTQDSKNGDKKFNSLKKVSSSRKASKEDQQQDNSHIASLDRKYLKFFSGGRTQNFNPVPTAQFRSYRRVPPMEKPPFGTLESNLPTDLAKSDSLPAVPVPSASPTRPPDMADYRLASLAKCPNPRAPESAPPGGYMTLESFMLSRQEEERRHQSQQPRATNILRVPQCQAPPPPTPLIPHNVAAATGHEPSSFHAFPRPPVGPSTSAGKSWPERSSHAHKFGDASAVVDVRPKYLKKTAQYQPPPWDPPVQRLNEDVRLQPAFEMTLDRQPVNENAAGSSKVKKMDVSSSSSLRFKNLFSSSKTDTQKTNLINSPRLRRVLFRDKKNSSQAASPTGSTHENAGFVGNFNAAPLVATHPPEVRLPNAPDYPGLQYPPIFEPGSYSLSDVSNLLRSSRVRSFDNGDDAMSNSENFDLGLEERMGDSVNNNNNAFASADHDENQNPNSDDNSGFSFANV